jgi:hypothetical protein
MRNIVHDLLPFNVWAGCLVRQEFSCGNVPHEKLTLSYHDVYITTPELPRTALSNLPFNVQVLCTRTGGWEVWHTPVRDKPAVLLAGEFAGDEQALRLDVAGHVIVDRLTAAFATLGLPEPTDYTGPLRNSFV